ncbi:MAG: hypothetical protein ACREJG_10340 [Candidatus Rokuibacteriota bacterium]
MNFGAVRQLAQTLLYEGYLLYPYRASALKNRHRWTFGSLYPRSFAEDQDEADPWWMQTQCLVRGDEATVLDIRVRFLHLAEPDAVERDVDVPARGLGGLVEAPQAISFEFAAAGEPTGLRGAVDVAAELASPRLFTVSARVQNLTPFTMPSSGSRAERRDAAVRGAFVSTHLLLGVRGGEFVSLVEPPPALREAAARCQNIGVWPVLVGDPSARDMILSAPVVLDDYPMVAPESRGDYFDATEIDELLTLRILTLTEAEKGAMQAGDARARRLLERTEGLDDEARRRLHGVAHTRRPVPALQPGVRVRLAPRRGGDVFDLALAGKTATVVTLEEDYEGRLFVAVTVDDDPGQDLGLDGRPGHRFFFRPDEVELLP